MAEDRTLRVRALLDSVRAAGRTALTAPEGKVIADAYGIAVPGEELAADVDQAVAYAARFGGPVVMKIVSPDILHKTDAGGVVVGVEGASEVRAAFCRIVENARAYDPGARIEGVQVQELLPEGQEVIVGAVTDPTFSRVSGATPGALSRLLAPGAALVIISVLGLLVVGRLNRRRA